MSVEIGDSAPDFSLPCDGDGGDLTIAANAGPGHLAAAAVAVLTAPDPRDKIDLTESRAAVPLDYDESPFPEVGRRLFLSLRPHGPVE